MRSLRYIAAFWVAALVASGEVEDCDDRCDRSGSDTGDAISNVSIAFRNLGTGERIEAIRVWPAHFLIVGAPPGWYSARFEAKDYQTKEIANFQAPVALRMTTTIALRKRSALLKNSPPGSAWRHGGLGRVRARIRGPRCGLRLHSPLDAAGGVSEEPGTSGDASTIAFVRD